MKTIKLLTLVCFLFLASISGAFAQLVYTNQNNGSAVTLQPNAKNEIVFKLKQSGGTAYNWELAQNNETVCKFVKAETESDPNPEGMVGTPLTKVFKFESTGKPGASKIKFVLKSVSGEIAETFTFTVKAPAAPKKKKK